MLETFLQIIGGLAILSFLGYIIPQFVIIFSKPLDLHSRYGGGWAFVTGGSSGIGEAFAKKVAKMGFNVAILGQNEERLNRVEKEIKEYNPEIKTLAIKADLSGDPVQLTENIMKQLDGKDVSIMFFNAGINVFEYAAQPSEDSMQQFRTNVISHQHLFHSLFPKLASRKVDLKSGYKRGAMIFTSSVVTFVSPPGMAVYAATKSYLSGLAESLASEADVFGIDVVSIYPGGVNTRIGERLPTSKVPTSMKSINQSPDQVAALAVSAIGRFTHLDSGFQAIILRILSKFIDSNIFIQILRIFRPLIMRNVGAETKVNAQD
ncbi:MAG: putative 17 beta-hydroxysteroid dehydrogenase type 3 [Streblomastix strix]|uniref:Putative 17 beta-hydroxysteroid dehydrogenase type 3 n=1 Tax=Streblomastix strix TaxID=222440 RepID=A0A5J4W0K8_9EUKA|nr:MAG: putative 17 beta-hydroxysteroid dehydrogenase type 3 [Streblomastix strix]